MRGRTLSLELADEQATRQLGEDLAAALKAGDVLALEGDLGMGKTTLARAIVRALAGEPDLDVPSPTFTLVQAYRARIPVQHFDLYRISSPDDLEELGFAEAAAEGVVLVEWPARAGAQMPADAVTIVLDESGGGRTAAVSGPDAFIGRLERSLAIRTFLEDCGLIGATRRFLIGDASTRAYETVSRPGRETVVLMNAPRLPDGPPIRGGKPYSQIAHLAESVVPFVAVDRVLREKGFSAPEIHAADLDRGLLLIEHLGGEGVLDAAGAPLGERYVASARLLAEMHAHDWPDRIEVAPGLVHRVLPYDRQAMAIETELVTDWYMPFVSGRATTDPEREGFAAAWRQVFDRLESAETKLVLRDFHSPNIIWRADRAGRGRIGLIDFQDALIGPSAYDVASLAMDARVTIPPALEQAIVEAYCADRARQGGFDRDAFDEAYAIMAAQRNSKILGIFVRLDQRDGKPQYLRHLPRIRDYIARALKHPSLGPVRDFYERAGILEPGP